MKQTPRSIAIARTRIGRTSSTVAHTALAAVAALANVVAATAAAAAQDEKTGTKISADDLRQRLYIYAADSMMGREAGTDGNVKATDYLAAELRRIGLAPGGEDGSYFQTIPLMTRGVDETKVVQVAGAELRFGEDYVPLRPFTRRIRFDTDRDIAGAQAIYGGRWGDRSAALSPEQIEGRLVVLAAPLANGSPNFRFWRAGGLEPYSGAAGVAIVTLDISPPPLIRFLTQPRTILLNEAAPGEDGDETVEPDRPAGMLISDRIAELLLGVPLDAAEVGALGREIKSGFAFAQRPIEFPARNVIGVLPGADPRLRGQYVAISAHNDHVGVTASPVDHDSILAFNSVTRREGAETPPATPSPEEAARIAAIRDSLAAIRDPRPDSVYNGADDDGSGTVVVLELAEALAGAPVKPKRSVLFIWHTAEEKGLLGAEYYADNPTVPRDSIVALLNMDMMGHGGADDVEGGGPGYLQLIGTRRLSTELGDLIEEVNERGDHGLDFHYEYDADGHPAQYYCRSDHVEYAKYGIPIAFFSTGNNPYYHQLTDEPQYIDYDKMARLTRFLADLVTSVADLDHRVLVDKPKPDPTAPCRQ